MKTTDAANAPTDCLHQPLLFDNFGTRQVLADFSAGHVSSDGGLLFLRLLDSSLGLTRKFSLCFRDRRNPDAIEHTVHELNAQRILGLAVGYEDLNDHDRLRHDPVLANVAGKTDPLGQNRRDPAQRGKPRAGVRGYLMKDTPIIGIMAVIDRILAGHIAISDRQASLLIRQATGENRKIDDPAAELNSLSDRELQVLEALGKGLNNHQIADILGVSPKTVGTYKTRLMEKTSIHTTSELARHAQRRLGLAD